MKVIAFGDVMDGGTSVFTSVAKIDGHKLLLTFSGIIRIDNPYTHLQPYVDELNTLLPGLGVGETNIDFTKLKFCNSNGFYVIMDITEAVYRHTLGEVVVHRLAEDDWQQETLPILIDVDDAGVAERTRFVDCAEL
ncbi:MAG: hypothetical protein HY908_17935 [Myxococcales bacterium]|nr:hypothetical protein [Myxococcales bacterium]